ncbi:MAG: hypothetical protein JO316_23685 [Abitibacteriaceae bacterium]|nr:hypothetical protein [Abditibacteriaceae bacterium]
MWRSTLKILGATTGFAAIHSLLASRGAKQAAARIFGQRQRNGWYRLFYLAQSFLTLGALGAYLHRLPSRDLYEVRGPLRWLMRFVQAGAICYAVWAAYQVGISEMLGLKSIGQWLAGEATAPEPEAQGPALAADGTMRVRGPFNYSRHPLNLVPVFIFWLWPRMTTKLLAFNIASTAYLVLGSIHEETRLRAAYGEVYKAYQKSSVPFYLPLLQSRIAQNEDGSQ